MGAGGVGGGGMGGGAGGGRLPTPMLWERSGSACAVEVEGLKRRPPM